jgi:hypothetical protein
MTLKEKFYPYCDNEYSEKWVSAENCEDVADDYAIEILEYYHNNLFYIPLKDGEAKYILNHIKNEKGL